MLKSSLISVLDALIDPGIDHFETGKMGIKNVCKDMGRRI